MEDLQLGARFSLQRRLGAGAFGVVYEAYDQERKDRVALKVLHRVSPDSLYRFKQEFRALTGLIHPNLVPLYELVSHQKQWFFTMELIEGKNFFEYVRGDSLPAMEEMSTLASPKASLPGQAPSAPLPMLPPLEPERLRNATRQLAEGVQALHRAGKLHRDIKPSNVLVTEEGGADGRVVLLDFGLVVELDAFAREKEQESFVVGTALYMSPEQAAAKPLTEASDWYSVGVMLYQTLTGKLPFAGSIQEILLAKQEYLPASPSDYAPDVPEDLDALTRALLQRDPQKRPDGHEIIRRLGAEARAPEVGRRKAPFVGREAQQRALSDALQETRQGAPVIALVYGPSGMGKTSLLRLFLDDLTQGDKALVLEGRCYEREQVPYKALDGLIDALSRYFLGIPRPQVEALLPQDVNALSQIFPVLRHLGGAERGQELTDPHELRHRASFALRGILTRLSRKKPLVLFIDDLQWGDLDSVALLEDLLMPPDPPPLLLLGSYRSEEAARSPFLEVFLPRNRRRRGAYEIEVAALSQEESLTLALTLLGRSDEASRRRAEVIAREAGGSPYFIDELVRARDLPEGAARGGGSLDDMLAARIEALPEEAQRLLEVTAMAGRPIEIGVACAAAGLSTRGLHILSLLCTGNFLSARGARDDDKIECYHDRIRETLFSRLSPERQQEHHRALAQAMEAAGRVDPEAMVYHLKEAGEPLRAAEYARVAAQSAAEALAFDQAATLYRLLLSLHPPQGQEGYALSLQLAESLSNAGRSTEAAEIFLAATQKAAQQDKDAILQLKERAATELLRSGHIEEGFSVLQEVLQNADLSLAKSPRQALLSMLRGRLLLRLRGLHFKARRQEEIPKEVLQKIDLCWSVSTCLGDIDAIRGADFQTRHMRLALKAGEPLRFARALTVEAAYIAADGGKKREAAASLLARAEELARQVGDPRVLGMIKSEAGNVAMLMGEWRRAFDACEEAERFLRAHCGGAVWEALRCQIRALWSLCYLGEVKALSYRVPRVVRAAEERGDLYTATSLRAAQAAVIPLLAADELAVARGEVESAMRRWSPAGFHVQHYNDLIARAEIDLYEGGAAAFARVQESWGALSRSLLLFVQVARVESYQLRARSALAAAQAGLPPKPLLALAERDAKRLHKENMPWARAMALLLQAAVKAARRQSEAAAALLTEAIEGFERAEMALYAAAARRRLGELFGGDRGRAHIEAADSFMNRQGVRKPRRLTAMLAPGFSE